MSQLLEILASTENANGDPRPVEIVDIRAMRGLYQTHAGQTLGKILADHGEGHLRFVLATILQSENNANALVGPVIDAVSEIALSHPEWADNALSWLDAFDRLPLMRIYDEAKFLKANSRGPSKSRAVQILLAHYLRQILGPDADQGDLFPDGGS